ncbi:mannose-1-phosphate guanylyltransferase [Halorientalis persicus]|uniref:Mannose-1-phosphate guanylyltransferase n=1 Tax=Halorientalis persicus TaxID=1367881 RepID=A0A1H8IC31_9EURY|nr:sugar phosphate nucleotidyltransferase [Halorientalis persicus]SEN65725.1 mannose-1-phosphate guanylyltransferase [Halorientalis persicus]
MDRPLVAVVLAGGTGTRLYPASRSHRPKQFQSFGHEQSLLSATVDRAGFADEVYVLTRPEFAESVREHAPQAAVLTEPEPRDTGPAMVYAAHRIRDQLSEAVMVTLPSDHRIDGDFAGTARTAAEVADSTGGLVTVGVEPTRPASGYGYIEPGERRDGYHTVASFTEKPDRDTAEQYVDQGYYWNAGIFAWTPNAFLGEARQSPLGPLVEAMDDGDPERGFAAVDPVSVDYAVLERTDKAYVVPASFEWDDLGSWDAVERLFEADEAGNVVLGDALRSDATDNVVATDGHVSAVGVSDLVIASYGDRTLVIPKDRAQEVREVVAQLREEDRY